MILTAAFILGFGVFIVLCICPASGEGAGMEEELENKQTSSRVQETIFIW
nr:hypothetical protein [uncultured Schaedlerella sp.]